jgi:hypothetical protein
MCAKKGATQRAQSQILRAEAEIHGYDKVKKWLPKCWSPDHIPGILLIPINQNPFKDAMRTLQEQKTELKHLRDVTNQQRDCIQSLICEFTAVAIHLIFSLSSSYL